MSIDTGIVSHLKADAAVSALIGDRVYHQLLPQNAIMPALIYSRISDQRSMLCESPDGFVGARYSIDCYARDSSTAKGLSDAVRLSLNGLRGSLAGESIDFIQLESQQDLSDVDGDTATRRVLLDFVIWYLE